MSGVCSGSWGTPDMWEMVCVCVFRGDLLLFILGRTVLAVGKGLRVGVTVWGPYTARLWGEGPQGQALGVSHRVCPGVPYTTSRGGGMPEPLCEGRDPPEPGQGVRGGTPKAWSWAP